jgi:hypothetical protein
MDTPTSVKHILNEKHQKQFIIKHISLIGAHFLHVRIRLITRDYGIAQLICQQVSS